MEVTFKYSIGDTVRLDRIEGLSSFGINAPINWQKENHYEEFTPREYKIAAYAWHMNEDGAEEKRYCFHINDEWIGYNSEIPEDYLSGVGETHTNTEEINNHDLFGEEINLGDTVYDWIYGFPYKSDVVTCQFKCASEVLVTGFTYRKNICGYSDGFEIEGKHQFPCEDLQGNPYKYGDCRQKDYRTRVNPRCVVKTIPDTVVDDLFENPQFIYKKLDMYERDTLEQWLRYLGKWTEFTQKLAAYEKDLKKLKKDQTKSATRATKKSMRKTNNKKVEDILSTLSDAEKDEMMKLLQKES